jgi:uncharacterized protein (DUF2235 family)
MSKNIVVFADGTGQEGGLGNDTNVYKLFNMIEDRTARQVAFYDPGVGTGWRKITGNVGGVGISRNIRQSYRFIFEHFEAGDHIYLIGFSRGAATVRSLSSFIHHFGILPKSRPELIKRAYKIYTISNRDKRKQRADEFVRRNHTMWTRIKFLGCYDTVAALGLPFKAASAILDGIPGFRHKFHDFRLSASVENASHALAIDDERTTFHPVLWDDDVESYQTLRQVWFAGMHTDVGGGYKEQELSDIALVWLTNQAFANGLRVYPRHRVGITEDAAGMMHDSRGRTLTKLFRKKVRGWDPARLDKPVVHQSVTVRAEESGKEGGEPYRPWILDQAHDVEPWQQFRDGDWV